MLVDGVDRQCGSPTECVACLNLSWPEWRCRYAVLVDGAERKGGSLFEDFEPAINPPEEIDDPEDSKPSTWVDAPKCAASVIVMRERQCWHNCRTKQAC